MSLNSWTKEFKGAITVCDKEGIILQMNDKAIVTFEKYGGEKLIGTNLMDCHPEPAKSTLKEMLLTEKANAYTIEKNGIKKLIYQTPWYENNKYMGFVELSLEIPSEIPHFVRK
jgi:transcriptional regulator with PAS, ATPase and Fis domain